jgi:hypothetical protein
MIKIDHFIIIKIVSHLFITRKQVFALQEGKIATAGLQFGATEKRSMNIRMRVLQELLLAWGRLGSISAPLVNQPVVY